MSNGFPRYNPSGGSGPRKSNDFPPLPPDTDQSLNVNKGDSMFDRNRDNNRFKRKYEDKDDSKGPRGRKSDSISTGSKYSGNRYEQEEVQQKQNLGNALFGNNSSMGNMNKGHGNMNMGPGNMGGGNMSDGMMQPPLPPMPPPQNSMMMGNIMGNNMGMGGNMGSNMGMGGNMGMGNMGGMGMNPMMGGGPNPMMNMGMNMMGQFPMMPPMPGPDGNMGGMMGPGVPQLMNTDFMNVFSKINTREPIPFSDFILYPPSPNAPPPTTRDRPLGCKTIFVGGLPENFKESQLQELFAKCGEIQNVRLSTKRFAHIRFMSEMSVDIALYFSGYRVRIEDKTDAPNTGRLHIDFAQARDDQYEYECQQRALDRERRHMQRMQEEQFRVPSPLPVVHYSDHEAGILGDKLKNEETFQEALDVICTWLERGECNKRNANQFYTLLQSTNSHVRHLVSEKSNLDEEIQRAKDMYAVKIAALGTQYKTVEKVFLAASQKKAWDHFSKAQRKSIESWKKAAADIKILMPDEDNMDTESEDEDAAIKPKKIKGENKQALKDENDSLRCQLEAYKNEVEILKLDMQTDLEAKDKQLKVTQKTLENVQMNLMDAKREHTEAAMKTMALNKELVVLRHKLKETNKDDESEDSKVAIPEVEVEEITLPTPPPPPPSSVPELDAKLIGLISIFLHIHPFGASVEYIWSYVSKFVPSCKSSDLEAMMSRYPSLFTQDLIGIGANIERRWKYLSLD